MGKQKKVLVSALLTAAFMSQTCPVWAETAPAGYGNVEVEQRQWEYARATEGDQSRYTVPYKVEYGIMLTGESVSIIEGFVNEHIKNGMSDFEKEMAIIKWMADRVHIDKAYTKDSPMYENTFIFPIELGYGNSGGYVDAFKILAMASGLDVKIVGGYAPSDIAHKYRRQWNQVCLDGAWYNVYMYKADRDEQQDLDLRWINLTDEQMAVNYIKTSDVPACTGTQYGIGAAEEYCKQKGWAYTISAE